jgi:hypothetical protein
LPLAAPDRYAGHAGAGGPQPADQRQDVGEHLSPGTATSAIWNDLNPQAQVAGRVRRISINMIGCSGSSPPGWWSLARWC